MKYYAYFPGCSSSEGTAVAYGISTSAIGSALGMELIELDDWNCCGSTPYSSTYELQSLCIAARDLALAEKTGLDLVTPCSACYTVLNRANFQIRQYPDLSKFAALNELISESGDSIRIFLLKPLYKFRIRIIFINIIGLLRYHN